MCIVEDPFYTVNKLFDIIKEFGELAGFQINYKKTKIMCKNIDKAEELEIHLKTGCEVVDKFKYLGIIFTQKNRAF